MTSTLLRFDSSEEEDDEEELDDDELEREEELKDKDTDCLRYLWPIVNWSFSFNSKAL